MKKQLYSVPFLVFLFFSLNSQAQYPSRCSDISARNNSNGQSNQCAGSGATIASNFIGTPYATVPAAANTKTADITFKYGNTNPTTLKPFAITKISVVNGGVITVLGSKAGPATVPTTTGGNDALVKYCIYITQLPNAGTLIMELTNPETGLVIGSCSYDASCDPANTICASSTTTILPVRITEFAARRFNTGIVLKWTTEEESNITSYEVERSQSGVQFEKIGTVSSRTATAANVYTYTDQQPSGTNYYRLKIIHASGGFEYSKTIQVRTATPAAVIESVTPNPFRDHIAIKLSLPKSQVITIQLLDFTGREVTQLKTNATAGTSNISVDNLNNLPNGSYVVKVQTETGVLTQKITK